MKFSNVLKLGAAVLVMLSTTAVFAQHRRDDDWDDDKKHGKRRPHYEENHSSSKHGDYHRKPYRYKDNHKHVSKPGRGHQHHVTYYTPKWHPHHRFCHRWVYFPRYNMYWDNYRNVYVYHYRGRWISQRRTPHVIINVNLARERFYEIDRYDDCDDIYSYNGRHKITFTF